MLIGYICLYFQETSDQQVPYLWRTTHILLYMPLNKYNNLIFYHLSRITVDEDLGRDTAKTRCHCPEYFIMYTQS